MTPLSTDGYAVLGHGSSLLNMAGHATGVLLFGIFLLLLARDRAGTRLRGSGLVFAAAGLALAWNLGALFLIATSARQSPFSSAVEILSFSSLSLLAPVLLHLSLNHRCPLAVAGYLTGAAAVGLHLAEVIFKRPELHFYALTLMAIGLGGVTLVAAAHLVRSSGPDRQSLWRQLMGTALLFIFVGTYVHVGLAHGSGTWSNELILHHASVPLALLIILQNHRFVLLDALIRFCANAALAVLFTLACLEWIRATPHLYASADLREQGLLGLGFCLLFLLFALARERVQRILTRIVFRRGDAASLSQELRSKAIELNEEAAYLGWALDRIAGFMHADRVSSAPEELSAGLRACAAAGPALSTDLPELRKPLENLSVEVIVPLRFSASEMGFLLLGRRRGGQRYLSEDLRHLGQFGSQVSDQVQAFRESELRRLAVRAELQALQAQINPHFLFNALNTLYGLVPRQAAEARQIVSNLADLFRYFLRNESTTIPLEEELRIIEAYLHIESLRLGGKLRTEIRVDPNALRVPIPLLSIQPLVENAVRHGIARTPAGGVVRLEVHIFDGGLRIAVEDTGPGFGSASPGQGTGVGLQNVARRLKLAYGPNAELRIESGPGGAAVRFTIPISQAATALR